MSKASPPKKKSAASASPAAAAKATVTITPEIEEEVKALLKAGTWKEMKQESTGKTYFYNKSTKATCWDLRKEIAKQKAAGGGSAAPAAAANPFVIPTASASEGDTGTDKGEKDEKPEKEASSPKKATGKKASGKSSKASAKSSDSGDADKKEAEEEERRIAQENRENEIRENSAKETAAAVAAAVAEVKHAAALERQQLENKELQIKEQEMNLEHQRNVKLRDLLKYTDPLDRLVQENSLLQQMVVSGSSGYVALDFQAKYEATMRTNNALTVQMARMKQEYDAMQRALTDANFKIHQQQVLLQERQAPTSRSRDEELQLTMSHLREQNRELVTQVCELSMLLSRGLNEVAYNFPGRNAPKPEAGDSADDDFLATSLSRVLDSPARQVLCSSCMAALTRLRDQAIPASQSSIQPFRGIGDTNHSSTPNFSALHGNNSAHYVGVGDHSHHTTVPGLNSSGNAGGMSSSPRAGANMSGASSAAGGGLFGSAAGKPSGYSSVGQRSHTAVGAQVSAAAGPQGGGASPIMYGGFMVRNPKATF